MSADQDRPSSEPARGEPAARNEAARLAERLTTTLESITDGFFTLDRNWRFSFLNSQAERLLHRSRADLLGAYIWDEFAAARGSESERAYTRAMRDNVTVVFEDYYPPLDTWFQVSAYPSEEGVAVYFRDITEQRALTERLRDSEARFRAIAMATADAVWDWDLVADKVWWNDGVLALSGCAPAELASSPTRWAQFIHPDDRERVLDSARATIAERKPDWEAQYRVIHRDGTIRHVIDRGTLLLGEAGVPRRFLGGMTDITERMREQEQLRQQAALLNEAQDAIIVATLDRRILYWNKGAERMYGWPSHEVVGRAAMSFLYDDTTAFEVAIATLVREGRWRGQIVQQRRDGSAITVEGHWTLMRDASGTAISAFAINTDISQRLALEEQLRQSQRLESVGQLTGGVAHDFNNLLTVIMGNAELLATQLTGQPELKRLADMTRTAAERGAELTYRLLAFSRQQALNPKVVDVNALLRGMEGLLGRTLTSEIAIQLVPATGLWPALIDPAQLEAAVLNLCINARDAMPGGGQLVIATVNAEIDADTARRQGGPEPGAYVCVRVTDTGSGIAPDVIGRVFDPFFTTKPEGKGTGLGLSMVYGFLKQSGGHVTIASRPGQGTTVDLFLPRARDTAPSAITRPEGETAQGGGETILMVEDNEMVRSFVERLLHSLGYRTLVAADGPEALKLLAGKTGIDLLFTDVVMPGMNGGQLAEAAEALRPGLRVLFTSGYTEDAILQEGRLKPGVRLLSKPYRRAELATALREALDKGPFT